MTPQERQFMHLYQTDPAFRERVRREHPELAAAADKQMSQSGGQQGQPQQQQSQGALTPEQIEDAVNAIKGKPEAQTTTTPTTAPTGAGIAPQGGAAPTFVQSHPMPDGSAGVLMSDGTVISAATGTTAGGGAVAMGSAPMPDGSAGVMMSDGTTQAAPTTTGGFNYAAAAGAGLNAYGNYNHFNQKKYRTDQEKGEDLHKTVGLAAGDYFGFGLATPAYHALMRSKTGRKLEREFGKLDPAMALTASTYKILKGKGNTDDWVNLGTGGLAKTFGIGVTRTEKEDGRLRELKRKGLLPPDYNTKLTADSRSKQHKDALERGVGDAYAGRDKDGKWVNTAWLKSGDEKDLKPEDIWGYAAFLEKYKGDWLGKFSEEDRRRIAQAHLDKGQVAEDRGSINLKGDVNLDEVLGRPVSQQQGPSLGGNSSQPAQGSPDSGTVRDGVDHIFTDQEKNKVKKRGAYDVDEAYPMMMVYGPDGKPLQGQALKDYWDKRRKEPHPTGGTYDQGQMQRPTNGAYQPIKGGGPAFTQPTSAQSADPGRGELNNTLASAYGVDVARQVAEQERAGRNVGIGGPGMRWDENKRSFVVRR